MIKLISFGFKHGFPKGILGLDIVDCRQMRNPHQVAYMRQLNGRHIDIQDFMRLDVKYPAVMLDVKHRLERMQLGEGTVAFGCYGGRHRSVAMAELTAQELRRQGHEFTIEHRDLGKDSD